MGFVDMTMVSKYLQFARSIIINIPKNRDLAKITLSTHEKLESTCRIDNDWRIKGACHIGKAPDDSTIKVLP